MERQWHPPARWMESGPNRMPWNHGNRWWHLAVGLSLQHLQVNEITVVTSQGAWGWYLLSNSTELCHTRDHFQQASIVLSVIPPLYDYLTYFEFVFNFVFYMLWVEINEMKWMKWNIDQGVYWYLEMFETVTKRTVTHTCMYNIIHIVCKNWTSVLFETCFLLSMSWLLAFYS